MAVLAPLIVDFNKTRDQLLAAKYFEGKAKDAFFNFCNTTKDLLVQSELDAAVLKGKLQALQSQQFSPNQERTIPVRQAPSASNPRATPTQAVERETGKPAKGTSTQLRLTQLERAPKVTTVSSSVPNKPSSYAQAAAAPRTAQEKQARPHKEPSGNSAVSSIKSNPAAGSKGPAPSSSDKPASKETQPGSKATTSSAKKVAHPKQTSSPEESGFPKGTVILQAQDRTLTGQQIKEHIASKIAPESFGLNIQGVFVSKRQVVVKLKTREQAQTLLSEVQKLQVPNLNAKAPAGKLKSLIIFAVPEAIAEEEVIKAVCHSTKSSPTDFRLRTSLRNPKELNSRHLVLETTAATHSRAVATKRLCLGFHTVSVRNYTSLLRCKRCQRFGHTELWCEFPVRCTTCGSVETHQQCSKPKFCINCARVNKLQGKEWNTSHTAADSGCPSYKEALALAKVGKSWVNPNVEQDVQMTDHRELVPAVAAGIPTLDTALASRAKAVEIAAPNREESISLEPQPPHLKKCRNRILSPRDSPERSPSLTRGRRYPTRGRSQDRQRPGQEQTAAATKLNKEQPTTIPETQEI